MVVNIGSKKIHISSTQSVLEYIFENFFGVTFPEDITKCTVVSQKLNNDETHTAKKYFVYNGSLTSDKLMTISILFGGRYIINFNKPIKANDIYGYSYEIYMYENKIHNTLYYFESEGDYFHAYDTKCEIVNLDKKKITHIKLVSNNTRRIHKFRVYHKDFYGNVKNFDGLPIICLIIDKDNESRLANNVDNFSSWAIDIDDNLSFNDVSRTVEIYKWIKQNCYTLDNFGNILNASDEDKMLMAMKFGE